MYLPQKMYFWLRDNNNLELYTLHWMMQDSNALPITEQRKGICISKGERR